MMTVMNILAIALMTVIPYVRPCNCGEFTLFCKCGSLVAIEDDGMDSCETPEPMCPK
ncbi:MAG: hypothetical protein K8I27_03610 [Planctomycetes bacterium]|nr:hypothetical protein [Planctomycetota bacterium]